MSTIIEKKSYKIKKDDNLKKFSKTEKKRPKGNWKQRLVRRHFSLDGKPLPKKTIKKKRVLRKSLFYIVFLRKMLGKQKKNQKQKINFLNLKLLRVFLTKYGKIKPRRKTRIQISQQRIIAKSIRRARVEGLFPFIVKVLVKARTKKPRSFSMKSKFSTIKKKN